MIAVMFSFLSCLNSSLLIHLAGSTGGWHIRAASSSPISLAGAMIHLLPWP
jgi:hypothetical protein